ncbi:MAG: hypothetical protein KDM64_02200 [Verrucomicrobiae bacterium]|nr:hypothetical protein [Verrucomicrobiae bacterium]
MHFRLSVRSVDEAFQGADLGVQRLPFIVHSLAGTGRAFGSFPKEVVFFSVSALLTVGFAKLLVSHGFLVVCVDPANRRKRREQLIESTETGGEERRARVGRRRARRSFQGRLGSRKNQEKQTENRGKNHHRQSEGEPGTEPVKESLGLRLILAGRLGDLLAAPNRGEKRGDAVQFFFSLSQLRLSPDQLLAKLVATPHLRANAPQRPMIVFKRLPCVGAVISTPLGLFGFAIESGNGAGKLFDHLGAPLGKGFPTLLEILEFPLLALQLFFPLAQQGELLLRFAHLIFKIFGNLGDRVKLAVLKLDQNILIIIVIQVNRRVGVCERSHCGKDGICFGRINITNFLKFPVFLVA